MIVDYSQVPLIAFFSAQVLILFVIQPIGFLIQAILFAYPCCGVKHFAKSSFGDERFEDKVDDQQEDVLLEMMQKRPRGLVEAHADSESNCDNFWYKLMPRSYQIMTDLVEVTDQLRQAKLKKEEVLER